MVPCAVFVVVVTLGVRFAEKVFGDVNLLGSMQCFELSRSRGAGKEWGKMMKTFVIRYRRTTGEVECTEFVDFAEALRLRHQLEDENSDPDVEIVSLTSESLDMLKQTHRRYFLNDILAPKL